MTNKNQVKIIIIFIFTVIVVFYFHDHLKNVPIFVTKMQQNSPNASKIVLDFYKDIQQSEKKIYSQNGEDGVLMHLAALIGIDKGFFVEFGTQNAMECNTRYIREVLHWKGLLLDGSNENAQINLHKEFIEHSNIADLFKKYNVPLEFDILSEDTDYADYWIVEAILMAGYRPKILIHEINQQTPEKCVAVTKPSKLTFHDRSIYHGGSVYAFYCLAKRFDYTMIYCESIAINCVWMRNDILLRILDIEPSMIQKILNPIFLSKKPGWRFSPSNKTWHTLEKC